VEEKVNDTCTNSPIRRIVIAAITLRGERTTIPMAKADSWQEKIIKRLRIKDRVIFLFFVLSILL